MKQGNQFYYEMQITDENNNLLDVQSVSKIQFTIDNLIKIYDGISGDVTYDDENQIFKIWLTENETFNFKGMIKVEARILFKNDTILGTSVEEQYVFESLKKEPLDVQTED